MRDHALTIRDYPRVSCKFLNYLRMVDYFSIWVKFKIGLGTGWVWVRREFSFSPVEFLGEEISNSKSFKILHTIFGLTSGSG